MSRVDTLPLPGPIALVPAERMLTRFAQERHRYPDLPDPTQLGHRLTELSFGSGVPSRIQPGRNGGDPRLVVCAERFVAVLFPTTRRDAYVVGELRPLRFHDHEQLRKAALLLRPTGWHVFPDLPDVSRHVPPYQGYWARISQAWERLDERVRRAIGQQGTPDRHLAALDLWDEAIAVARVIETAKQRNDRPLPYRAVGPAREERYSKRGVYVFELAQPAELGVGTPVALESDPPGQIAGRIRRVEDREVTVQFDQAVNHADIPPQGALRKLPSDRVFRAQAEAVQRIRDGEAASPHLMRVLVDCQFAGFHPDRHTEPALPLDDEQRDAFGKALAVPDLSLVLGPPGTGKTRTIAEMARACAARGQRVLVVSHANRAVDNMLKQLPPELRSVRVGNEGKMTTFARTRMVEVQVTALRDAILAATEGDAADLSAFTVGSSPDQWLELLGTELDAARVALAEAERCARARAEVARRVAGPAAAEVDQLGAVLGRRAKVQARRERTVGRREGGWQRAAGGGPLGRLWRRLAERRLRRARQALEVSRQRHEQTRADLAAATAQLDQALAAVPEAEGWRQRREQQLSRYESSSAGLARSGAALCGAVTGYGWQTPGRPGDLPGWGSFQEWAQDTVGLLRTRSTLVIDWRQQLARPGEELQAELVRYADVVAATCVGTATTSLLRDLTFDLAIIDEAGQIALPNLLIPLVRARRAVLVGDHRQLPPYADDDITRAGGLLSTVDGPELARQLRAILTSSAFELLFDQTPEGHRTMLVRQRRMPPEVAAFISAHFYDRALETAKPVQPAAGPLFSRPFVLVDTSDRTPGARAEQRREATEAWAQAGRANTLEARIITRLLLRLAPHYADWGVIVPYRAQVDDIVRLLRRELAENVVRDNVGTVDSFQGGERELVVYGFTRSNRTGDVGFLGREPRRLNVALSRVSSQLVVVGDTSTLTSARNRQFQALARALVDHVRAVGDVLPSRAVEALLDTGRSGR
ncbi:MAG TPA: AAA domain-containing protein [Mycobacteriales bacterium]|nr:AAA domain-containing protein [Mycobacteriales bacterium]